MKKQENAIAKLERDLDYIEIMIDRLMRVGEYLERATRDGYSINDEYVLDNLSFQVGQAGEQLAQGKLSKDVIAKFPNIKWNELRDYRNFIAHSYNARKNSRLVIVFTKDVPEYIKQLSEVRSHLLAELENECAKTENSKSEKRISVMKQIREGKENTASSKRQNPTQAKSRGSDDAR